MVQDCEARMANGAVRISKMGQSWRRLDCRDVILMPYYVIIFMAAMLTVSVALGVFLMLRVSGSLALFSRIGLGMCAADRRRRRLGRLMVQRAIDGKRWHTDPRMQPIVHALEYRLSATLSLNNIVLLPDDVLQEEFELSSDDLLGLALSVSHERGIWWPILRDRVKWNLPLRADALAEALLRAEPETGIQKQGGRKF